MSLSDYADISQVAGCIVALVNCVIVLVSVFYLWRQLRQNELNQQALIQQGRAARISSLALQMAQMDVAGAWEKGAYGHPISLSELHQFRNLSRSMFMSAEDSYFQYQHKVLHEEGFESFRKSVEVMMRLPGLRAMWVHTREMYGANFTAFIDGVIARAPVNSDVDELARWAETMDAIKRSPA